MNSADPDASTGAIVVVICVLCALIIVLGSIAFVPWPMPGR